MEGILFIGGESDGKRMPVRDDMDTIRLVRPSLVDAADRIRGAAAESEFDDYRRLKLRGSENGETFSVFVLERLTNDAALGLLIKNYHGSTNRA